MTINAKPIHRGKVRDTFELSPELLLLVSTDKISTHNIVHENDIPDKGRVLTALTVFWLTEILPTFGISSKRHHLVAHGHDILRYLPENFTSDQEDLIRRSLVVKKLRMYPLELIYRAYLTGSLYKKYYSAGLSNPYGLLLPPNMALMESFTPPIFTPTEKSETDDPMDSISVAHTHRDAHDLGLLAFHHVRQHLNLIGIELIDTKLEMGVCQDGSTPIIADEVFTPDSSRFCNIGDIQKGNEPTWLDKQIARDYAEKSWGSDKKCPVVFPEEIVLQLTNTYRSIFERITGKTLEQFQA